MDLVMRPKKDAISRPTRRQASESRTADRSDASATATRTAASSRAIKSQAPCPLPRAFFAQSGADLAAALPGVIMTRRIDGAVRRARIVEVEAYLGPRDLASHSSKGRTKRTEVMFGPAGRAYVYFIYGVHWMFNIVAGVTGEAHAVLLRGAQPIDGWNANLSGPGLLARAFGITAADNGMDLFGKAASTDHEVVDTGRILFFADPQYRPRIVRTKRIGVDYAKHWKNRLLRFVDARADE